jgi:hypothetical protein
MDTKFFHGCINKRRRDIEILSLEGNDRMLREVDEIKNTIVDHFQNHFSARGIRPVPGNMNFKRGDNCENEKLVEEFTEEGVRSAVGNVKVQKGQGQMV